jgi:hypothetical protein
MSEPRIATVPGITPIVQLGIGDTRQPVPQAGRWDVSHWDSATDAHWAALEPQWLDITCDVHGVDTRLGHERTLDRWEVGTALIDASNATGWADVLAQVDDPALIALRPGRQIRWGARIDATGEVVWRFRGYIDTHSATYRGLHLDLDAAQLSCIDALGEVGRVQLGRLVAPVGAGESMTARVHRILDAAAWHADRRAIAAVPVAMIGTDLNGQAIDLLGQAADSGSCALYGDYSGRVALREPGCRARRPTPPLATARARSARQASRSRSPALGRRHGRSSTTPRRRRRPCSATTSRHRMPTASRPIPNGST